MQKTQKRTSALSDVRNSDEDDDDSARGEPVEREASKDDWRQQTKVEDPIR